jgi:hypothetical protein
MPTSSGTQARHVAPGWSTTSPKAAEDQLPTTARPWKALRAPRRTAVSEVLYTPVQHRRCPWPLDQSEAMFS